MTPDLAALRESLAQLCAAAADRFKSPAVRITLLARDADHPDGRRDVVVTDDDLGSAAAALLELRKTEAMP